MAIDGTYEVEVKTPIGRQQVKLNLKTDGAVLSGSTESTFGLYTFNDGTVNGD